MGFRLERKVMESRIYVSQTTNYRPKILKKLAQKVLWNEFFTKIETKFKVKQDKNVEFIELFVFSNEELQEFIEKVEKRVYNNIACAKTKGSC